MKEVRRNVGVRGRIIRVYFALMSSIFIITDLIFGFWSDVLFFLACYAQLSSMMGFDPLYYWLDKSTMKKYDYYYDKL